MSETAKYLRRTADQCLSMARYHTGEAASALKAMALEMQAKADELAAFPERTGTASASLPTGNMLVYPFSEG